MADCWDSFVNLRVPSSAGNFLTSRRPVSLSGTNLLGGSYLDGNSCIYVQVSQEEWTKLRESVPYVELYRYNPKHLYPKLNVVSVMLISVLNIKLTCE